MSPWRLRKISRQIERGAIIAYPTDTIWGFGCSPLSHGAVKRVQQIKRRSASKGLILLSSEPEFFKPFIDETTYYRYYERLSSVTNKPVTWLVKASEYCPRWLTGNRDTIAIRLTRVSQVKLLCDDSRTPLVSTSANISRRKPVRNSLLAHKHFHHSVDYIIEGFETGSQQASRIIDLKTAKVLRA